MFTDIFMFSADEQRIVRLLLGPLATRIMQEEFPLSRPYMQPAPKEADDDMVCLLELPVCSYNGIGRFVMGLYEDIRILGDEGFCDYIRGKIEWMKAPKP